MNITQAINQIIRAVRSCLAVDSSGYRIIPASSQRPILLYGPPGIGKTAIVRQAAASLNISFLSYTMTHHTRQSAIGLPQIVHREFNGKDIAVTEYTMSDIMRDVYEAHESSPGKQGILFLDEINCVSETLMPAMLELLQFKRFGKHRLPGGWIIVCAGNPEEYNRSAHAFDPVTMDRVRMIHLEPDIDSWLSYASSRNTHPTILSYLRLHPEQLSFYAGEGIVTPRSWSDLSAAIIAYEALGVSADSALFEQYLQDRSICDSFAMYFSMCNRCDNSFDIMSVLSGNLTDSAEFFGRTSFDEQVYLVTLVAHCICSQCEAFSASNELASHIDNFISGMSTVPDKEFSGEARARLIRMENAYKIRVDACLLESREAERENEFLRILRLSLCAPDLRPELLRQQALAKRKANTDADEVETIVRNGLLFADTIIQNSSLRIIFVTELRSSKAAMKQLRTMHSPAWDHLRADTDIHSRTEALRRSLQGEKQV